MDDPFASDSARDKIFDNHVRALGLLCVMWATLDSILVNTLKALLRSDNETAAALFACETSARCEIIKRLAHVKLPAGAWRERLLEIVTLTQGDLAEKRNRYVHDEWSMSDEGTMVRIDRRPKLKRPQSRQPLTLTIDERETVSLRKLEELIEDVARTMLELNAMTVQLMKHIDSGQPLEQLPPPPRANMPSGPEQ